MYLKEIYSKQLRSSKIFGIILLKVMKLHMLYQLQKVTHHYLII